MNSNFYDPARGMEEHQDVAASQTDKLLGAAGDIGDYLDHLDVAVAVAANSQVSIRDGKNGTLVTVVPANTPIGFYTINLRRRAEGSPPAGWYITTASGVTVACSGRFT